MYQKQMVEELLRNYSTISHYIMTSGDEEVHSAKLDLDRGMIKLQNFSKNLHQTLISVFVWGTPIQEQAKAMKVSKRQIHRRLDDGVHFLTMIMNGEVL
jgi:hypothetical protein